MKLSISRFQVPMQVAVFICTAMIVLPVSTLAQDISDEKLNEINLAIEEAESLADQFQFSAAVAILEKLMIQDLPIGVKSRINTHLADIYRRNLDEEEATREKRAVECLLDNLREQPSYEIPTEFEAQLRRLYDQALNLYRSEVSASNKPPHFTSMPSSKRAYVGRELRFSVRASDPDGDELAFGTSEHVGLGLEDRRDGTSTIRFTPVNQIPGAVVPVWVFVDDGLARDSAQVLISISAPGAHSPSPMVRSLILPGWGQRTQGRTGMGTALMVGGIATFGLSVITTLNYNASVDDYYDALDEYRAAQNAEELRVGAQAIEEEHQTVSDARGTRNLAYIAFGVVYAFNVIDAVRSNSSGSASASSNNMSGHSGFHLAAKGQSVHLVYSF